MAVLHGIEKRFYQVPDDVLAKYLIPADQVDEVLHKAGICSAPPAQQQQQQQQPMAAPGGQCVAGQERQPVPQGQVQAYHRGGRGGYSEDGHGGFGVEIGVGYPNYSNYSNYSNYANYRNFGW
jgi:hypothetical protein